MQVVRHGFQLDEVIAVSIAYIQDCVFNHGFNLTLDHLAAVLRAKHDVVVDIVDAVVYFSFHVKIIALERVFVNNLVALTGDRPFHPTGQVRGFSGAKFYKKKSQKEKSPVALFVKGTDA